MTSLTQHQTASLVSQLAVTLVVLHGIPNVAISGPDEQIVDELIDLSGLKQQIPRLPNEYMTLVDQVLVGIDRRHPTHIGNPSAVARGHDRSGESGTCLAGLPRLCTAGIPHYCRL